MQTSTKQRKCLLQKCVFRRSRECGLKKFSGPLFKLAIQSPTLKPLGGPCISVSPHHRIAEYEHSEADTVLLHIYSKMRSMGIMNDVVADAEDTGVVVMCAYAAHKINETLGLKWQQSI